MPEKRQRNKSPSSRARTKLKPNHGATRKITKAMVEELHTLINKGYGVEQAFAHVGVGISTGYGWMAKGRDAKMLIHHSGDEEEKKEIARINQLYIDLVEGINAHKNLASRKRDAIIEKWAEEKDWKAAAHLNQIHNPAVYGNQALIDRGVQEKLQFYLDNLFYIVSASAYKELKKGIELVTENKYNFTDMDELKAVQTLIESEWLNEENAQAIGTEYMKMREAMKNYLMSRPNLE